MISFERLVTERIYSFCLFFLTRIEMLIYKFPKKLVVNHLGLAAITGKRENG